MLGSLGTRAQAALGIVAISAVLDASPALSQTATPPPPDPAPAEAQAPILLPPVTATATRGEKSLVDTPANTTAIVRKEMDRQMMVTIEDAVRYQPGVQVSRQTSGTDPFKSLGGFTIRGVGGNRILTLVDGSRTIERITDQTRDFVDLSNMKKMEIVRGPASVLWGSDALGGVVAFTTKDPADYIQPGRNLGFQIDASFNSYNNAFTETFTGAFRAGPVEAMLSYTRRDASEGKLRKARSPNGAWPCTRAPESLPCDRLDPADISSNSVLGKILFHASEASTFKLTGEYFGRLTTVDQLWDHGRAVNSNGTFGTIPTLDYRRWQDLTRYRIALEHDWKTDLSFLDAVRWQVVFHPQMLDRTGRRLRQLANGDLELRDDSLDYTEKFYEADLQLKSSFALGPTMHRLTYGFAGSLTTTDYKRKDVTRNQTTGATTTVIAGGFNFANARTWRADGYIQDEIALWDERLLITPGLRFATYRILPKPGPGYRIVAGREPRDIYADDLSAKLGIVFKIDKTYSLYGQYAEGFKMPTAEQLFTSLPSVGFNLIPNPDLKPEKVKSFEIGVRGQFDNAFFSINAFHASYTNFIQSFVSIPNSVDITYQNLSRLKIWGIEATGAWRIDPQWELSAALSWQRGDQRDTSSSPKVPYNGAEPFKLVGGARWTKAEWGLDVDLVGTWQTGVSRVDNTPPAPFKPNGYVVFDLTANWEVVPGVILRAAVLNMFDKRYFLPSVANSYDRTPSTAAVAATNPLELQTQPGRTFRLGLTARF